MRRTLTFIAKIAISALLLFIALRWVNFSTVRDRLRPGANLLWFSFAFLTLLIQVLIVAVRWREIIRWCGKTPSTRQALRYVMIANFFNQTLPSSVGGDAARIVLLARSGVGWAASVYSVIIDRVFGVLFLALLVIACLPWSSALIKDPIGRTGLFVIGFGCLAASILFLALGSKPFSFLGRWAPTRHLAAAAAIAARITTSRSIAHHCGFVGCHSPFHGGQRVVCRPGRKRTIGAGSRAIFGATGHSHHDRPHIDCGLGRARAQSVVAFVYAGLPDTDGLLVSLLFGAATFLVGAVGGLVWILTTEQHDLQILPVRGSDE